MTLNLSVALQFVEGDFSARVYLVGSIIECKLIPDRVDLSQSSASLCCSVRNISDLRQLYRTRKQAAGIYLSCYDYGLFDQSQNGDGDVNADRW